MICITHKKNPTILSPFFFFFAMIYSYWGQGAIQTRMFPLEADILHCTSFHTVSYSYHRKTISPPNWWKIIWNEDHFIQHATFYIQAFVLTRLTLILTNCFCRQMDYHTSLAVLPFTVNKKEKCLNENQKHKQKPNAQQAQILIDLDLHIPPD